MKKVVWVLLATGIFGACSLIVNPDPDKDLALECAKVPSSQICTCSGGKISGKQTCLKQGVWSQCSCETAGSSAAGNGGNGGSGGKSASGAVGGKGGSSASSAAGGKGASGGKSASGAAGTGGIGGSGGAGGGSEKSATYGTCTTDEDCESPGVCREVSGVRLSGSNKAVIGHVCTESCQSPTDCPAADDGTARKQCPSDEEQCILTCATYRTCPTGTACITETDTGLNICAWLQ